MGRERLGNIMQHCRHAGSPGRGTEGQRDSGTEAQRSELQALAAGEAHPVIPAGIPDGESITRTPPP